MENKNLRNALGLFTGAMGVQLADMARGVFTGKGDAWLPNSWAEKYKNIKNASTANWWKSAPTQAARLALRAGSVPAVGAGAYLGTKGLLEATGADKTLEGWGGNIFNAANSVGDFLIDNAKSAGTIANNIFNKAGNFASQGLQYSNAFIGNDAGLMETPEMKDYLKNLMLNRIRESGNLSGNELGYSDYDPKSTWSGPPNSLSTSTGLSSPNAAYQNTLGSGSFNVPEQGGYAQWKPSSTVYDFSQSLADKAGGFNPFNVINRGGLRDILIKDSKGTYKDGTSSLQHMIPNVEITPEEIQEIFGGGGMLHKGEGIQDRPEINSLNLNKAKAQATSTQPISQPTGTSATALAQIQANISAAATKEKLLNKKQSIAPIDRTKKTTAASGMMSSGGPPRRSSRAGRKKPAKTSYGRRYGL